MDKIKSKQRSEKGSVTLFVLVAMMFFLIILLSWFMGARNKMMEQSKKIKIIQNEYNTTDMENTYLETIDTQS